MGLIWEYIVGLSDIIKWQLEIWKVILSFIARFYLHFFQFTYQWPTNPDLALTDWGLLPSLGHVGCQEARQMPPCLEALSVKMLPPNQSLMGFMRHGFGCENKHGAETHPGTQLWLSSYLGFGAGWAIVNGLNRLLTKTIMEHDDRSWNRANRAGFWNRSCAGL